MKALTTPKKKPCPNTLCCTTAVVQRAPGAQPLPLLPPPHPPKQDQCGEERPPPARQTSKERTARSGLSRVGRGLPTVSPKQDEIAGQRYGEGETTLHASGARQARARMVPVAVSPSWPTHAVGWTLSFFRPVLPEKWLRHLHRTVLHTASGFSGCGKIFCCR
eukprot:gene7685-biopygen19577